MRTSAGLMLGLIGLAGAAVLLLTSIGKAQQPPGTNRAYSYSLSLREDDDDESARTYTSGIQRITGGALDIQVAQSSTSDAQGQPVRQRTTTDATVGPVTVERNLDSSTLWRDWAERVRNDGLRGNTEDLSLRVFDARGERIAYFKLTQAAVVKYEIAPLLRKNTRPPRELITLSVEDVVRTR